MSVPFSSVGLSGTFFVSPGAYKMGPRVFVRAGLLSSGTARLYGSLKCVKFPLVHSAPAQSMASGECPFSSASRVPQMAPPLSTGAFLDL